MDVRETARIDASLARVHTWITSEDYQREKAHRLGAVHFTFSAHLESEIRLVVESNRTFETDGLPDFVRALVRPMMTVHEVETWGRADAQRMNASFNVDVDGAPVEMRGGLTLRSVDAGCCEIAFWGTWRATVPLFRQQIEDASVPTLLRSIQTEIALLTEWAESDATGKEEGR